MAKQNSMANPLRRRRRMRGGPGRPKDEKPLTLRALAESICYTEAPLTLAENGSRRMSDGLCEALARFYGVEISVIREEADQVWAAAQRKKNRKK